MKEKINAVIDGLIVLDYILFISVFVSFLALLIIALLINQRRKTSRFIVTIAFAIFIFGPTVGYMQMHNYVFKNTIELVSEQKLEFTKAIVVHAKLTNLSKRNFKECKVTATAYIKTPNEYKNMILRFKPIVKSSIVIQDIEKNQNKEIKMFIEPFYYQKEYEVGLKTSCR
jgi:hypothetical protein